MRFCISLSLIGNQAAKTIIPPGEDDNNDVAPHNIAITHTPQIQIEQWEPCAPFKPHLLEKMLSKVQREPHKFRLVGNVIWINKSAS